MNSFSQQKKELVVHVVNFLFIMRHLYKMGANEILQRYVPEFEHDSIFAGSHRGAMGGHYVRKFEGNYGWWCS